MNALSMSSCIVDMQVLALQNEMQQLTLPLTIAHLAARADLTDEGIDLACNAITGVACRVVFCTSHTKGCCASPVCSGENDSSINIYTALSEGAFLCVRFCSRGQVFCERQACGQPCLHLELLLTEPDESCLHVRLKQRGRMPTG